MLSMAQPADAASRMTAGLSGTVATAPRSWLLCGQRRSLAAGWVGWGLVSWGDTIVAEGASDGRHPNGP